MKVPPPTFAEKYTDDEIQTFCLVSFKIHQFEKSVFVLIFVFQSLLLLPYTPTTPIPDSSRNSHN